MIDIISLSFNDNSYDKHKHKGFNIMQTQVYKNEIKIGVKI